MAEFRNLNAPDAAKPISKYSQAVEVSGATRILHISGQVPVDAAGNVPSDFTAQARLVWRNLEAQLRAAGMNFDHLVIARTFLSDRRYAMENRAVRLEFLGAREPATTTVICGIFDEKWLLEIEAVAMA